MPKILCSLSLLLVFVFGEAQEVELPSDFRQHTLTQFNANLLNPTYAQNWNNPNSLAVWSRWQWQTIDGDPTTIFANYTHQISEASTGSLGFLQHNTGVFLDIGGNLNYVYKFSFGDGIAVLTGVNVFASQRTLADDRFISDAGIDLTQLEAAEGFMVQFSPGIRLQANQLGVGLAFENAIGVGANDSDILEASNFKTIVGSLNYDVPISFLSGRGNSFIRPMVYVKSIPDGDTQIGVNGLLSTPKVWLQGGYNSFYGASAGLGVTLGGAFSVGGLMEFGTDTSLSGEDPTLELLVAYRFARQEKQKKESEEEQKEEEEDTAITKMTEEQLQKEREALEEKKHLEEEQKEQELIRQRLLVEEQRRNDSIQEAQALALQRQLEQQRQDSLARLQKEKVAVQPNERYEEVAQADGLVPGFYLIANVFGTKKYFENFMKTLQQKGLEPKSFYRSANKYNYVYLERYNTMEEARKARDSKFSGKYPDKTWIFRVKAD